MIVTHLLHPIPIEAIFLFPIQTPVKPFLVVQLILKLPRIFIIDFCIFKMITRNYPTNISKKQIFLLSVPIFFSNLAIPLVGIIDTGLMGNLGQTKFLAATSIATSVMTMIIWSFGFFRMGTVGIVAQLYG